MNKNNPSVKGVRTAIQAIIGTAVTFLTGLWAIPEVRDYTTTFIEQYGIFLAGAVLALVGVTSGIISWLQNQFGESFVSWLKSLVRG